MIKLGGKTTFGVLGNYVNGFTCSPHVIESPRVSTSPHLSPLVPKIVGKSTKIDSVVFWDHLAPHFNEIFTSEA